MHTLQYHADLKFSCTIFTLHMQMLTSKRYDLEGFAEYAHHLSDCQTFHKSEAKHIDYVLRVHSTLRRNGVKVPQEDEVHCIVYIDTQIKLYCIHMYS